MSKKRSSFSANRQAQMLDEIAEYKPKKKKLIVKKKNHV